MRHDPRGRRPIAGRLPPLAIAVAVLSLAGCGGSSSTTPPTTTTAASIRSGPRETVTFAEVDAAIADLYRRRPAIGTYVVRDVRYDAATRDKVLDVCHRGGLELDRAALESSRIAGCAPLIFFFSNFGRQKDAPEATALARKLYWYAVESIRGPFDARASLDALLDTWSVG